MKKKKHVAYESFSSPTAAAKSTIKKQSAFENGRQDAALLVNG